MKYFKISYKRGKQRGKLILAATNRLEAIKEFQKRRVGVLVKIQETSKPLSFYLAELRERLQNPIKKRAIDLDKLIAVYDQLYIMLDAGLPINFALEEIVKNSDDKLLKAVFGAILEEIEGGKSFYEAALPFSRQIGRLSLSMIRLGEETGTLAESLRHLRDILENILENRRKFKKATRYPIFIMFAMSIAFVVVILMVIPQFEAFFKESQMELPLPTRFLLWLEHALIVYGPYIVVGALVIFGIVLYLYKKDPKVELLLDRLLLKIYIVGAATLNAMISRFMYVFRVLVEAGIPMLDAIEIASGIVENSYIRQRLRALATAIEEGRGIYDGFRESGLFENMVVEMIRAGEMGGGLGKMLAKAAKIYQDRFDYIVDNIATLIEPILIAAIAGFVLTLALGIFLPMWNMVNVAG